MHIDRADLAMLIDYTLLQPTATAEDVAALLADAKRLGVPTVCVSPSLLHATSDTELRVATVCGFPSGKHHPLIKATEARFAVQNGAVEIDVVADLGSVATKDEYALLSELVAIREAITDQVLLKVILETAAFDRETIEFAARTCAKAGANFVKTSTGFHPAGGASIEAVRILRDSVPASVGVKASGGIRDYDTACAMIEAGASRLGVSNAAAVLR
ncbi:deoxyribose-phosphate aldolase [Corynebacterium epidermidicanis]|uniref:Deoxyribose-phosphate aldolase n=1 Tax=Corynebacterium epidermidicanis TaxID=1050174 RepID=A0A0G3GWZ0_9CORY|nr:deoxyribose-phosphate aldolase [Corynebacterium epidermidicanis]AKK04068.1 deoxyribose-phosphate aldolase [Corynebacterium epidermidicanis]